MAKICPSEIRIEEARSMKPSVGENGVSEGRADEIRMAEIRVAEVSFAEDYMTVEDSMAEIRVPRLDLPR